MTSNYRTAPDGSYTMTEDAIRVAAEHVMNDWLHGFPGALNCDHIFAALTMAEGYDDATARSLAGNIHYRAEIVRMQMMIIRGIREIQEELGTNNA